MKTFKSLPQNIDFYHRYAGIIPALHQSGYLAQVISFMTEIGIIYSILYQSVVDFVPQYAQEVSFVGAFIGAGFIELGLRKLLPYSVRQVLNKRYTGLDRIMTIFIFLGTVLLLLTSGVLSFKGSKDLVEWAAPEPVLETTSAVDSLATAAQKNAVLVFQKDSTLLAKEYEAMLNTHKVRLKGYEDREARTNKDYTTRKQRIREKIAALENELSNKTATIWKEYKLTVKAIETKQDSSSVLIVASNEEKETQAAAKVSGYGGSLGYFTVVCLAVLVISVVLYEVYRKGADIEEKTRPNQYAFSPSLWSEAKEALSERFNYLLRNRIAAFTEATPEPPLPKSVKSHYDLSHLALNTTRVESEANKAGQVIRIPLQKQIGDSKANVNQSFDGDLEQRVINYTKAAIELENINLHNQAADMFLKAEEVLKMYLGTQANEDDVLNLKNACIAHLNNGAPNPFEHHHRRQIGFRKTADNASRYNGPVNTDKTVIDSSLKNCKHCNGEYKPKTWNQKYCSSNCKTDFHASKHGGKRFEPGKFHGKKRK